MPKPSKRPLVLAGGAVAVALVLAAGAVTVASAMSLPTPSTRLLDDHGIDTRTSSPAPSPTRSAAPAVTAAPSSTATPTPEPGDDQGQDGVVTVPPAGPTVIDRHGIPIAPDDEPGAHDRNGHGGDRTGAAGGDAHQGEAGDGASGHPGADDAQGDQ